MKSATILVWRSKSEKSQDLFLWKVKAKIELHLLNVLLDALRIDL